MDKALVEGVDGDPDREKKLIEKLTNSWYSRSTEKDIYWKANKVSFRFPVRKQKLTLEEEKELERYRFKMMDQTRSMIQIQHLLHAMRAATFSTSMTEIFRNISVDTRDFLMCQNIQIYIVCPQLMHWFTVEEKGRVETHTIHDQLKKSDEKLFVPVFVRKGG